MANNPVLLKAPELNWREHNDESDAKKVTTVLDERFSYYTLSVDTTLASGATGYFLGITNGKVAHYIDFHVYSDQGDISIELFEAPTTTANGTAITAYDVNRTADTSPTFLTYAGPTVTDEGTKLIKHVIPDTGNKVGGEGASINHWQFKTSTKYLVKIVNNSNSTATMTNNFYWKEI